MKKQLLMIGGGAIMMATAAFAGVGSAEGAARNEEDAVAKLEREEQRRSLLAIQNELRQQRAERQREEQSGRGDDIRIDAKHVHLKSVLGVNEALLADTNRFALVEGRTGRQTLQLDTPFGGFSEAIIYLDGVLSGLLSRRRSGTTGSKPRRLHGVALRRWLPDTATDKDFLSEWQASCDFVASILGVGVPKVQLADVKEWRNRRHGLFEFRRSSRVTFNVANDQKVVVCLEEPVCAIRDGKFIVVRPGLIFINIDFNHNRLLCDTPQNGKGEDVLQKTEKEIDFGPDCADRLAKAIHDNIDKERKHRTSTDKMGQGAKGEEWELKMDKTSQIKEMRKAAEQGHAKAQYGLGWHYANGDGVEKDMVEAVKWYHKAAEQGDVLAQDALGGCYAKGMGVPKDMVEAVKWIRKAAEHGLLKAQYNLGFHYAHGLGVLEDKAEAVKWFRKAAEQGYGDAQFAIGISHEKGYAVTKDKAEAIKWYRKAAAKGHAESQSALKRLEQHP